MLKPFLNILTMIKKELLVTLKDKTARATLVGPIIVQTLLFSYVATYDLNKVEYVLLDEDHSYSSRELISQFDGTRIFKRMANLENASQISEVLDNKKALLVLHIGRDFEKKLNLGNIAPVQILVDGRNSNTASIASSYATRIIERFNEKRLGGAKSISTRAWFNPNLATRLGMLSALSAVLALIQVLVISGQSVASERERGSLDQLLVTPFNRITIMLGKALPPVLIGLVQSSMVLLIALYVFSVPIIGSFALLYLGLLLLNLAVVGIGLMISVLSSTMQQAMLYCFTLIVPMILLSGLATPISSMPEIFQWATLLNPVRYAVEFAQKVSLEGAGFKDTWRALFCLFVMAAITLSAALQMFRTRL